MKISITGNTVELSQPALDKDGRPLRDALGNEMCASLSMTLDQYAKHARDPGFAKAAPLAERAAVELAIEDVKRIA